MRFAGLAATVPSFSPPGGTAARRCMAHGLHGPHGVPRALRCAVPMQRCVELRAAFTIGGTDGDGCPPSYSRLTTEAACLSLAAIAGASMYGGSDEYSYYPAGCFRHTVSGKFYWNTHGSGASSSFAQPLCAGAPATPPCAPNECFSNLLLVHASSSSSYGSLVYSILRWLLGYSAVGQYSRTHSSVWNGVLGNRPRSAGQYSGGTRVLTTQAVPGCSAPRVVLGALTKQAALGH